MNNIRIIGEKMRASKIIGYIFGYGVLFLLLFYAAVYFAIGQGWTNTEGSVDENSQKFSELAAGISKIAKKDSQTVVDVADLPETQKLEAIELCKNRAISQFAPTNAKKITDIYQTGHSYEQLKKMVFAASLRLEVNPEFQNMSRACEGGKLDGGVVAGASTNGNNENLYAWANGEEWQTILAAVKKDKAIIDKEAKAADLEPRTLVSSLVVEQLRLYFTQREYYEKFFKPYKILGSANNMAWGVMSMKEKAAIQIEDNLKNKNSAYYLGQKYENLLDFGSDNPTEERFKRLANDKDHSYSYLYGSLYLQEYIAQWKRAGYLIEDRPEILATLYNLGFEHSKPKADPQVGGSVIEIGGTKYTFGGLAYEFYYSGEMSDLFPYESTSKNQ
jgi:hypothetical protein